jgi:hypothetical protein
VPTAAAITRLKRWAVENPYNPCKCYLTSSGAGAEYWLSYIPWDAFRTTYQIGTQAEGAPAHISVDPNNNLVLGPIPDAVYTITGEYHRSSQVLAADADEPEMPSEYHMLIVYTAMEDAGFHDMAEEIIARSNIKSRRLLRQLMQTQTPRMRKAGPMA